MPSGSKVLSLFVVVTLMLFLVLPSQAEHGLTLADATFTTGVSNRQPDDRIMSFSITARSRGTLLWFWFQARCSGLCLDQLAREQRLPLDVYWYFDTGGDLIGEPPVQLAIEGPEWRTWTNKEHLRPGTWRIVVWFENERLCLSDETCEFTVEVTQ